jgi:CubicO group peptidase (beta-lactamase class C family)
LDGRFPGYYCSGERKTIETRTDGWLTSTPEEQGFDSAKVAEGLLDIKDNGTLIHSLMVLRNNKVILDAYFYPYDGSTYHDLASVTKSVMTTLSGIAIVGPGWSLRVHKE